MSGDLLDLILIALAAAFAVAGYRQGFIIGVLSFAGFLGGAAIGIALYLGLLRIPMRYFFTATNWLLLLVAAGMAAQAANFLVQADLLPPMGARLWDTSALLSDRSLFGQTLHALIGYDARPAGIQLAFYFVTVVIIVLGMKRWGGKPRSRISGAS